MTPRTTLLRGREASLPPGIGAPRARAGGLPPETPGVQSQARTGEERGGGQPPGPGLGPGAGVPGM